MSSREQFEAWYLDNWGHTEDDHETLFERSPDDESEYYRFGVRIAHQAWQAATSAMEAKCAALAAENAGLKSWAQVRATSDDALEQGNYMTLKIDWRQRSLAEIETPATDAFLAEVRAQGVEMYADNLDSSADDAERDGFDDAVKFLRSESSGVRLFAAQLRKGVQS